MDVISPVCDMKVISPRNHGGVKPPAPQTAQIAAPDLFDLEERREGQQREADDPDVVAEQEIVGVLAHRDRPMQIEQRRAGRRPQHQPGASLAGDEPRGEQDK